MSETANVLSLGQGTSMGWLSPSLPLLMADDSPLPSGPITKYDVGWIGSLVSLGAIFGTLIFGLLANRIGTKYALMSCPIPMFVSSYVLDHNFYTFYLLKFMCAGFVDHCNFRNRSLASVRGAVLCWIHRWWIVHLLSNVYS